MNRTTLYLLLLALLIIVLLAMCLLVGSIHIPAGDVVSILFGNGEHIKPSWRYIVLESRLPQALTALLSGGALAVSGLMLQTAFRNPLADPSIFGISSGASLGVALVMLLLGGSLGAASVSLSGYLAIIFAAFVGAMSVMGILLLFSAVVKSDVLLLIIGIMLGYLSSSVITLLQFFATDEGVKSYMVWGMGTFGGVPMNHMPLFAVTTLLGVLAALLLIKPLNALLLGDRYAENLGVNIRMVRSALLFVTGLLTAVTTAFCGPISFIGLAVPHLSRLLFRTDNHLLLMPATLLCGSAVALLCCLVSVMPGEQGVIPLAAVTPLLGAPVIIYIIAKRKG